MADASGACLQIQGNASQAPGSASGGAEFASQHLKAAKTPAGIAFNTPAVNEGRIRYGTTKEQKTNDHGV